ncbi:phasin family protein [Sedimentitalea sp. HM32M-2]|uniref:phasin family protein n=1 Tax=Sedimentitalea sp. HM32M-2 TaxID=3351566 RepID=UPI00363104B1
MTQRTTNFDSVRSKSMPGCHADGTIPLGVACAIPTSDHRKSGRHNPMARSKQRRDKADADTAALTGAMLAVNPMAAETWQDIMTESARFVKERLQKDLETQQAMMACKTPMELLQVQTEFYQTAIAQYTEEANRMFRIMSKTAGTARDYDDIPL